MNTIIFPTDFSDASNNALEYAIALAAKNNQTIHLVHTYELIKRTGMLPSIEHHVLKLANKDMGSLIMKMNEKYPEIAFTFSIHRTSVAKGVALEAKKKNASLVVMGTHGTSAFKEIFLGSNAIEVMNNSLIPVLLVPYNELFDGLQTILLTLDDVKSSTKENLEALKQIAKLYRAEIIALHVETNPQKPTAKEYLDLLAEVFDPGTVGFYEIIGENVEQIIENFAEEIEADIICTLKRNRGFLSELIRKSTSKQMIYQYQYPLLVLNENVVSTSNQLESERNISAK